MRGTKRKAPAIGFSYPNRMPKSRKAFRRACHAQGLSGRMIRGLCRELYSR